MRWLTRAMNGIRGRSSGSHTWPLKTVLMEIGDGLAPLRFRRLASQILLTLRSSPHIEVVPASARLLEEALSLYRIRDDKDWGMTDCSSFVVMRERGILDALTMDRHFQQAGFRPLLPESP